MLTKKQYNKLKKYHTHLETAIRGYIRGLYTKESKEICEIYSEIFDSIPNPNCASCMCNVCKQLGQMYIEYENKSSSNGK